MAVSSSQLTLYYSATCPFSMRVRHALHHLGLDIALKSVRKDPGAREELIAGGGRGTVPCLRTDHEDGTANWMYESGDIVEYLNREFGS